MALVLSRDFTYVIKGVTLWVGTHQGELPSCQVW